MKKIKIIFTILTMLACLAAMAQPDHGVNDANISQSPINVPTGIFVQFTTTNYGDATIPYNSAVQNGSVALTVSLSGLEPASDFDIARDVYFFDFDPDPDPDITKNTTGVTFSTVYDQGTNMFTITLTSAWPSWTEIGKIFVRIDNLVSTSISVRENPTTGMKVNVGTIGNFNSGLGNDDTEVFTWSNAILPLSLTSFTAREQSCGEVALNWTTAAEQGVSHFEVEYSSDASVFEKIGSVKAGTNPNGGTYSYQASQHDQEGYYRLKIVDVDGQFEYSDVRSVKSTCAAGAALRISPNPASNQINLSNLKAGDRISVYSQAGQLVASERASGSNKRLDISHLSKGIYNVIVSDGHTERHLRFMKQ